MDGKPGKVPKWASRRGRRGTGSVSFQSLPRVEWENGLRVIGTPLWLDATSAKDLCFISQPDALLAVRHRRAIASSVCAAFLGRKAGPRFTLGLDYHRPLRLGRLEISLLPSGYCPGSAQAFVKTEKGSILYSGPFSLEKAPFTVPMVTQQADVLVLYIPQECNGEDSSSDFVGEIFSGAPSRQRFLQRLVQWIGDNLSQGVNAVVLTERWRAPELTLLLERQGVLACYHRSLLRAAKIVAPDGSSSGMGGGVLVGRKLTAPKAVVWPLDLANSKALADINDQMATRLLVVSGCGRGPASIKVPTSANRVEELWWYGSSPSVEDVRDYVAHVRPRLTLLAGPGAAQYAKSLKEADAGNVEVVGGPVQLSLF